MTYLFILGREPLISTAELFSVLKKQKINFTLKAWQKPFCVIETDQKISPASLMNKLGGTIKISEILTTCKKQKMNSDGLGAVLSFLKNKGELEKKVFFGLSFYNFNKKNRNKNWGLEIKKNLTGQEIKSRLVTSREEALSSVTVKMNKLLSERGADIILAEDGEQIWLAVTLAVQPFEEWSERDYGRPGRDAASGMLPPKLARIMLNLTNLNETAAILDPFCGSGTILTEAWLIDFKNIFGSDLSPKAVADSQKNLTWAKAQAQVKVCDATKLTTCYQKNFFDAIITEPYLGPPLKGKETTQQISQITNELEKLYFTSLQQFSQILKPGGEIVMVWPIILNQKLNLQKKLEELPLQLVPLLSKTSWFEEQKSLIYSRPDQLIKREIVKIKKTP